MSLESRISTGEVMVCIIGMGYVGLPLARAFAGRDIMVLGFDIDPDKVEKLNNGQSYLKTVPSETVAQMRRKGFFEATTDAGRFGECDVIIICVPTPLTEAKEPDLSYVQASARQIAEHLREDQMVILESTTYPGTTEEIIRPILENTGLKCGKDFHLAFSPEREDPGNKQFTTDDIKQFVISYKRANSALETPLDPDEVYFFMARYHRAEPAGRIARVLSEESYGYSEWFEYKVDSDGFDPGKSSHVKKMLAIIVAKPKITADSYV